LANIFRVTLTSSVATTCFNPGRCGCASSGTAVPIARDGRGAGVGQFGDFDKVFSFRFRRPVLAGQAAIDDSIDDISADFLRGKRTPGFCRHQARKTDRCCNRCGNRPAEKPMVELCSSAGQADAEGEVGRRSSWWCLVLMLVLMLSADKRRDGIVLLSTYHSATALFSSLISVKCQVRGMI